MLIGIKIKQLLLGATLLVTNSVYSITNLECTTEIPTTTAIVNQSNNQVWLQFIHHNGAHLAPIHNGIITMNDLPYVARKGELISKMGDIIKLPFDAKNCKVHEEGNYHCFSNTKTMIGSLEVESYGFFTHQTKSFLFGTVFSELNFRLYARTTEGESIESEMVYALSSNDCRFDKF